MFWRVQRVYREQFCEWFGITAPTSLIGTVVYALADQEIREIGRTIPRFMGFQHPAELIEITALRVGAFLFAWFLGCFALGSIATVVSNLDEDESRPLHDRHQRSRENLPALLGVAVVTFLAYAVGLGLSVFVISALTKTLGRARFAPYAADAGVIAAIVVAAIVSWLGMAVPFVVRGGIGVRAALAKSLQAADGNQGFLLLMVIESVLGSYLSWCATRYGIFWLRPSLLYTWGGWPMLLISTLAAAAIEPPMFIGFSLLAEASDLERSVVKDAGTVY